MVVSNTWKATLRIDSGIGIHHPKTFRGILHEQAVQNERIDTLAVNRIVIKHHQVRELGMIPGATV
jgi:hypothetical protein